jgi:hypothetical protein
MTEKKEEEKTNDQGQSDDGKKKDEQTPNKPEDKSLINLPAIKQAEEVLKRMEEKEKAIEEREKALDEKIKEFDRVAADMKMGGFSSGTPEMTDEQKAEASARKLVEGTGLEKMAGFK